MKISGIKIKIGETQDLLRKIAEKKSGIKNGYFKILKKSLDARDKRDICYVYSVEISDSPFTVEKETIDEYAYPKRVAIIGFGPSGIFCGLRLSRAGFKPLIIERGQNVDDRKKTVDTFFTKRKLNTESNIQFGEGGAGAFSDGKLNTGVNGESKDYVLQEFVNHGAPKEILYDAKPHIGSDILPSVVKSIRQEIISLGGQVLFDTKFTGVDLKDDKVYKITVEKDGEKQDIDVDEVVLAIGHSSRDTYRNLYKQGIPMEAKNCAVGFRVEHLQEDINAIQFGKDIGITADYKLTSNVGERGVFSFCMCPGGVVVPATSETGCVCTNGMSEYARDKINANSAIVCQVNTSDYGSGILDGIDFIESIEKKAFTLAGANYSAPCQNVVDFLNDRKSTSFGKVKPSYALGTEFIKADDILPKFMCDNIRVSLRDMNKRMHGYVDSGVITAPETRTSSPVRIVRDKTLNAVGITNLYPTGEVGYAGGIMSSAMDGIRVAETIKNKYKK